MKMAEHNRMWMWWGATLLMEHIARDDPETKGIYEHMREMTLWK